MLPALAGSGKCSASCQPDRGGLTASYNTLVPLRKGTLTLCTQAFARVPTTKYLSTQKDLTALASSMQRRKYIVGLVALLTTGQKQTPNLRTTR